MSQYQDLSQHAPADRPQDIILRNVSVSLPNADNNSTKQAILHSINATFNQGTVSAIMGCSGSGKTTLLNVIARRYDPNAIAVSGSISNTGERTGYVTQIDYLLPYLTIQETLLITANLTRAEVDNFEFVTNIITELGLTDSANTIINNISGGEKRRVSMAVQVRCDISVP